jgi:hypothetical protein
VFLYSLVVFQLLDFHPPPTLYNLNRSTQIMSTLLRRFSQRIDRTSESNAPLNTDGARPQSGLYEKKIMEFYDIVTHPTFTLTDVVSLLDYSAS